MGRIIVRLTLKVLLKKVDSDKGNVLKKKKSRFWAGC